MIVIKSINVEESTWARLKSLAARNELQIGIMLTKIIKEYKDKYDDQ